MFTTTNIDTENTQLALEQIICDENGIFLNKTKPYTTSIYRGIFDFTY